MDIINKERAKLRVYNYQDSWQKQDIIKLTKTDKYMYTKQKERNAQYTNFHHKILHQMIIKKLTTSCLQHCF